MLDPTLPSDRGLTVGNKRTVLFAFVAFLASCLAASGCSQQDSEEAPERQKVVVKIQRPPMPVQKPSASEPVNIEASHKPVQHERKAAGQSPGLQDHEQEGWYPVTDQDTLIIVAGNSRVYSDPYKWPSLLRLNLDKLESFGLTPGLEGRQLPAGIRLRYLTPQEVEHRRTELQGHKWVVNILSDKGSKRISALALKLLKARIPVYIAKAEIKGQQWLRLRTGFFASIAEAKKIKAKIEQITGLKGLWVAKISDQEFQKYAGY